METKGEKFFLVHNGLIVFETPLKNSTFTVFLFVSLEEEKRL